MRGYSCLRRFAGPRQKGRRVGKSGSDEGTLIASFAVWWGGGHGVTAPSCSQEGLQLLFVFLSAVSEAVVAKVAREFSGWDVLELVGYVKTA